MKQVQCPTCGASLSWGPESAWRPFCSERCRLIDLGEWFSEGHRIPASGEEGTEDGADSLPSDDPTAPQGWN
jgi:endogenous inhibitor of DNA gyrase (YacG/DUF329 family)